MQVQADDVAQLGLMLKWLLFFEILAHMPLEQRSKVTLSLKEVGILSPLLTAWADLFLSLPTIYSFDIERALGDKLLDLKTGTLLYFVISLLLR